MPDKAKKSGRPKSLDELINQSRDLRESSREIADRLRNLTARLDEAEQTKQEEEPRGDRPKE
jgi:hypothetical protein